MRALKIEREGCVGQILLFLIIGGIIYPLLFGSRFKSYVYILYLVVTSRIEI